MKKEPYKRKPGEFEIRILSDGRVILIAPDEKIMEIAQIIDPNHSSQGVKTETDIYDR